MFTPRGYTAVPQDASQDEDENDNLTRSFEQRKTWSASRANSNSMSASKNPRDNEEGEKERRVKRNVRFESKSLEDKTEPMSNARRLCFVASLMICTLTIFVFAFTVPCKGPSCNVANMITTVTSNLERIHRNWSTTFSGYSTGIVFHLSASKTKEIIVSYDGKHVKSQQKHRNEGSGLISLKEENGELVWVYNSTDVRRLIECRTDTNNFETCLIQSSQGKLQLINPKRNQIVWSTRILIGSLLPSIIIGINDCDGDGGRDILLSYNHFNTTCLPPLANKTTCIHPGIVQLISGRTGYPLGSRLNIPQSHLIKRVSVHSTGQTENLIFVLTVGNKGHLKVISIQELYRKILEARGDDSMYLFKNSTLSVSEIVSTDHEPVVKDLNKDFVEDIILVTLAGSKHSLTAVDGGKFKKMWRIAFGSRKMLSQPVIGHFNDDEIPDILVTLEDPVLSLLNQSLVQILDGQNGNILWSRKLRLAKNTTPLAANIGYKSDVFLLWIEKESKRKYQKIFPSKSAKVIEVYQKTENRRGVNDGLSSRSDTLSKNASENTIAQKVQHDRFPRSVQSHEKTKSSLNDVESELDSLVDEIYEKNIGNTPTTKAPEKPHLKRKKIESTHKMLEDFLKEEGKPLNRRNLDKTKKANNASSTHRPILHTDSVGGKPSIKVPSSRMMEHNPDDSKNPSPTMTLVTQHLLVHKVPTNTVRKKTSRNLGIGEKVGDILLNSKANSEGHRAPTISDTKGVPLPANIRILTKKPSIKVSNGKDGQPMMENTGGGSNDKSEGVPKPWTAKLFISPSHNRGINKEQRNDMISRKRVGHDMAPRTGTHDGRKIGIATLATERPHILTTAKKPNIKISSAEKVQPVTLENRNSRVNDNRKSAIDSSQSERSLKHNDIHVRTEKPNSTVANNQKLRQGVIDMTSSGVNNVKQSPTTTLATTRPESQGNIKMNVRRPTTRIIDKERVEHKLHNAISGDQASTTMKLNNIPTSESNVVIPTVPEKDQLDIKISSDNARKITKDEKNKLADIPSTLKSTKHPISHMKQSLQTNVEIVKTPRIAGKSNAHILTNHSQGGTDINMEGMTDSKTENIQKSLANGTDITSPTKSVIRRKPVDNLGSGLQSKRLFEVNEPTQKIKINSTISEGDSGSKRLEVGIDHGIKNEVVKSTNNTNAVLSVRLKNGMLDKENKAARDSPEQATALPNSTNEGANSAPRHSSEEKPGQYNKGIVKLSANGYHSAYNKSIGKSIVHRDRVLSAKSKQASQARNHGKSGVVKVLPKVGDKNSHRYNKMSNVLHPMKLNRTNQSHENKSGEVKATKSNQSGHQGTSVKQQSLSLNTTQVHHHKQAGFHTTKKPGTSSSKKKHDVECIEVFDLALIAIFPNSQRNSFSVISQENSVRKKKEDSTLTISCGTAWPTLNSSPLVHDADSDGFLKIIYAVNYGTDGQSERKMKVRMFSIKVDSE